MKEKVDPELLQARWVLSGIRSDDLPDLAVAALQQGFDRTALRQLAGLVRPTLADLEDLPQRAFIDMGMMPMSKDQAVETGNAATGIVQATEVGNINKLFWHWLARGSCRITRRSRIWRVHAYSLTSQNQGRKSKQKEQTKSFHGGIGFPQGLRVQPCDSAALGRVAGFWKQKFLSIC